MTPTTFFHLLVRSDVVAAASTASTNTTLYPWLQDVDPNEYNGASVIPVAVTSAVIAAVFVCMRFYTRARLLGALKWDDWTILLSLLFAMATSAGTVLQLNYGLGQHVSTVGPLLERYLQAGLVTNLLYTVSLALTKISILLLYIRILVTYDVVRLLGKILLIFTVISHFWIVASILTTCLPLSAAWTLDPSSPPAYCHPPAVFWANACLHLSTNFLIFVLPLPVISSMRLPTRQKLGLYFVFCIAFLVCAISIMRLLPLLHPSSKPDLTWSAVRIANWTCVEVHAAIVTACLTTLKPLLAHVLPSTSSSSSTTSAASSTRQRQKDLEENFSTGDGWDYQRPLTIGTKSNRVVVRDTFASLMDLKTIPEHSEHVELATPTSATKLADKDGYKLDVDTGAPISWHPSLFRGSRLHLPRMSTRHERWNSVRSVTRPVSGRRLI
ncbi:hypothetical protein CTRI78_v003487 [Colletotrichum trifolii]|uniref:Rhodopsin domain-containing protein n=1 Tax=Colletotrichum trifolii TaxID=5466 RepID=A0A4R8RJN7_COLTR|nr:hypothetical protein CTRI78_v003487 [Colletotrichum trifolii]